MRKRRMKRKLKRLRCWCQCLQETKPLIGSDDSDVSFMNQAFILNHGVWSGTWKAFRCSVKFSNQNQTKLKQRCDVLLLCLMLFLLPLVAEQRNCDPSCPCAVHVLFGPIGAGGLVVWNPSVNDSKIKWLNVLDVTFCRLSVAKREDVFLIETLKLFWKRFWINAYKHEQFNRNSTFPI